MNVAPRHTRVVEILETPFGVLIREDYFGHPKSESNLYLLDSGKRPLWFAQRAMEDDAYANPVRKVGEDKIRCATWKGVDCEIDLKTGRLLKTELLK